MGSLGGLYLQPWSARYAWKARHRLWPYLVGTPCAKMMLANLALPQKTTLLRQRLLLELHCAQGRRPGQMKWKHVYGKTRDPFFRFLATCHP